MTVEVTDVAALRRWVRRRQSAHRERGATAGNVYFAVLFIAVVGGMLHRQLALVFWPQHPNLSLLAGAGLVTVGAAVLFLAMRRLGPLGLTRPAASWLLTAPVSRRRLLAPSLRQAVALAAVSGGLYGVAVLGHVAWRPMPGAVAALLATVGALAGVLLLLLALAAQGGDWGGYADGLAGLLLAAGLAGLVADSVLDAPHAAAAAPAPLVAALVAGLAALDAVLLAVAVGRLAATPNERILAAAKTTGTLLDSAFGVEPSFVADMVERRYWARQRLRSVRLWARVPVLVAQDLLLARRRPARLAWLAGATALPALLAAGPRWLLAAGVLVGGMLAGGVSTATLRTDAANPVLLRLLGLSSRQAVGQRMIVPGVLAGAWSAASLALLDGLGELPSGPWWALGLALAPVGAVAAVRHARVGLVRNELLPLDTPMGTVSPGPLVNSVVGPDALLLGLPTLVQIVQGEPLTWSTVLVQAVVAVIGARAYLSGTTAPDRVELTAR
ncbi:hypothetical protein EV385_1663 [Krasilnikovia cinnamomea]|uniref:ABC-2 type transport system permease protein n=1 Tax=Krasilnikovia cinnamomea TaxID=349313 RepID=A0A4V2G6T3_9ACTN|nr:DUF6297 family protein [Krasilnikovia cinnamomea]RZU49906.1 hypothetical protein EV385_1663 [Krasilnikovia cinnamomea]